MFHIIRKKAHHIITEGFRYHNRRIIFSGFYTFHCFFLICKYPVQLIILPQSGNHLLTQIDIERKQFSFIACICIGNCHLQTACVTVRIPTCCNIKPRIKRRNNAKPQNNNPCNGIFFDFFQVSYKDFPYISHCSPPPLCVFSLTSFRRASSDISLKRFFLFRLS